MKKWKQALALVLALVMAPVSGGPAVLRGG